MQDHFMSNSPNISSSLSKESSILLQLMDKSGLGASIIALIGSVIWCATMLFYFVNDLVAEPLTDHWIFYSAAAANFLSAVFILFFAHFLYHHQTNQVFNGFFLTLFLGCIFRAMARLLDGLNEVLYSLHPDDIFLGKAMSLLSDITHFFGFMALSVFMIFLLYNELKNSYKVLGIVTFVLSMGMSITYITLFLFDLGIISSFSFQITRLISFFLSIALTIFFSLLMADSGKLKKASAIAQEA